MSFLTGLQTPRQLELMKEHCGKIFMVDETHGTNQYKYKLLTCMVIDSNRRGWPVAHLISSKSDAPTLKFFFSALKELGGADNVTTVITDDDAALINGITEGFSKDLCHLLCKWHVLKNLKNNLNKKVPRQLFESMNTEIRILLNTRDEIEFKRLCWAFTKKYEDNEETTEFLNYFLEHYLTVERCHKWAMCYRKFSHHINTTGHIESFHNRLKKFYLKRKINKRLDDLVDILLQVEWDDHCSRSRCVLLQNSEERHRKGMLIDENSISKELDDTWEIKSGVKWYVIVRYSNTCSFDHCYVKCKEKLCPGLCSHLYGCTCPDGHTICKHIHKLHSFLMKDLVGSVNITDNFYSISIEPQCEELEELPNENCSQSKSTSERLRATRCDAFESYLRAFQGKVFSNLSDETQTFINKSFALCLKRIENEETKMEETNMVQMETKEKFTPNQVLKTQKSQMVAFKRPQKRKPLWTDTHYSAEKKAKVIHDLLKHMPEPSDREIG